MRNNFMDLLPISRQEALSREYLYRLGTVAAGLVTGLTLVAAVLLVPTYVFLLKSAGAKQAHLTSLKSTLSSADESALSSRLTALSNDATALIALSKKPSISNLVRSVLAISRPGVVLSSFTYAPVEGKNSTLSITGTAATREALRTYQLALQSAPFASAADLPVSAYAKDANIPFTITVTLAP